MEEKPPLKINMKKKKKAKIQIEKEEEEERQDRKLSLGMKNWLTNSKKEDKMTVKERVKVLEVKNVEKQKKEDKTCLQLLSDHSSATVVLSGVEGATVTGGDERLEEGRVSHHEPGVL